MRVPAPLPITECQACRNRGKADLCNLDGNAEAEFQKIRRALLYRRGQFVFYEGHAALGLYVLCSGRVKLTRSTAGGRRRLVGIVDPGMLIEKHTFQDGALHEVTCEALELSQVCVIDRSGYLALLGENGDLAVKMVKLLSREMCVFMDEMDQFAFASSRERLARLLLELAERYGEQTGSGYRINLQLKREELAQMAAMTVETTVRILKDFQASELIGIKGREIILLRPDRVARAARQSTSLKPPA